jgi:Ca2+-binding EF-hand superfamily protein
MNAATQRIARGACAPALLLLASGLALAAAPPSARAPADVHDLVFLAEARPVLIRFHVRVDGKPVRAAWDDFLKYLFGYLDVDGDGVLSKQEAERVPSVQQVLSGGLAGGRGLGRGAAPRAALKADRDGKVSLAELAAYYRRSGFMPFQVQVESGQANPLGALAYLGGRGVEPPVGVIRAASFALLDANKDGKLTKEELARAPEVLLRLDEDNDEIVTTRELVPNYRPPGGLATAGMAMMGRLAGRSTPSKVLVPVPGSGEAPADLVRALQERYGPRVKKAAEKKLSRKELGLDEATFRKLDANGDGVLDGKELAGFVKRAPDLEVVVRLGRGEARVEVGHAGIGAALAGKVQARDGLALLDLGVTRAEMRASTAEDGTAAFASLVRQQILAQFRAADKDSNGYLDAKEAQRNPTFRGLFKAMDRNGDGKLYEQEVIAYLDKYREIAARARNSCVSLVLTDQSRGLFDVLDVNRDGRLSVREMRGAVGLLKQLDRSRKGYLTKADIPQSYRLALHRGAFDAGPLSGAKAFAALYGGAGRYQERRPTRGPLWFRKMDRNGDGDVSRKEWLFSAALFRKIDTDGDGLISVEEAERYDRLRREQE